MSGWCLNVITRGLPAMGWLGLRDNVFESDMCTFISEEPVL